LNTSKINPVLKNIEIDIKEHDIVAIVGKNGSGKTTLLKIMDGLLKDFSGEVLVDGENVKSLTPRQIYSKMGLLFRILMSNFLPILYLMI